jgi:uncharacterized RDD family membrane protein YckC
VSLPNNIAIPPQRVINFLIDQVVIRIFIAVVTPEFKTIEDFAAIPMSFFALGYAVNFFYYFGLELSSGTTLGKLLTGTHVVLHAGRNRVWSTMIRSLVRLIPAYPLICLFSPVILLHDSLSKTMVLRNAAKTL